MQEPKIQVLPEKEEDKEIAEQLTKILNYEENFKQIEENLKHFEEYVLWEHTKTFF